MKNFKVVSLVILFFISSNLFAQSDYKTMTKDLQEATTPSAALQILKDGNKRFVENSMIKRDLHSQISSTQNGQFPYAIVLSCIDSRSPTETIFDQGIGDIFNARVAGNVVDEDILGSIEYACKVAGSKLVLVMGHSHCGAVKGACDGVEMGNITGLLAKIKVVVDNTPGKDKSSKNSSFVKEVEKANVLNSIVLLREKSPILKEMEDKGEILIKGAMYDIETGIVTFY